MQFSIITPSFRSSQWLKLCVASVADQQGVELEHIVQDSCSDDGTRGWLPHDRHLKAFIEKDGGTEHKKTFFKHGRFGRGNFLVAGDKWDLSCRNL